MFWQHWKIWFLRRFLFSSSVFLQKFLCKVWMTKSRQLFLDILLPIMILNLPVKLPRNIPCVVWNPSKEPRQKKSSDNKPKKKNRGKHFNLVYFVFAWTHQFQYWNLWFKLTFQHSTFMRNEDKVTSPRLNGI